MVYKYPRFAQRQFHLVGVFLQLFSKGFIVHQLLSIVVKLITEGNMQVVGGQFLLYV